MTTIAILGATGFVGGHISRLAKANGFKIIPIRAPRMTATSLNPDLLSHHAGQQNELILRALHSARGADALVNAAGHAQPGSKLTPQLIGANTLLPAALASALPRLEIPRLIHIGSAAVYGRNQLYETARPTPTSPYARSKSIGDQLITSLGNAERVAVLRPTSVHGLERQTTRTLVKFARSPLSSVAGAGIQPTPQVLVENVAQAALFLATTNELPNHPVLQPYENLTTASLLEGLGQRPPRHIPERLARSVLSFSRKAGSRLPAIEAHARRLEMLWFGQEQHRGWLDEHGFHPHRTWHRFFEEVASEVP